MVAWQLAGRRQLAGIRAFSSDGGRGVQGRRRRRPEGAKPWRRWPPSDMRARRVRAAETTEDRGRFDDESHSYSVVTTVARGRAHMTVLRREDVQSRIASWDESPYRITRSPILTIVPLIIRRLRGPSLTGVLTRIHADHRLVSAPPRVPAGAPPTGSQPARAQWPPRLWVRACVVPSSGGTGGTGAAAPCPRWR
jgi:hypothetical protein